MPSNVFFRKFGQKQEDSQSLPTLGQSKNKLLGNRPYLWLWMWAQGRYHSSTWGARKVAESKSIRESKSKRLSQRSAWLAEEEGVGRGSSRRPEEEGEPSQQHSLGRVVAA